MHGFLYSKPCDHVNFKPLEIPFMLKTTDVLQWFCFAMTLEWDLLSDTEHLLDKAMADMEIYSVETSNIGRGRRPSSILSWRD